MLSVASKVPSLSPFPSLSQALFLSHSCKVAETSDPQNFLPCSLQSPASPEPSQSLERTAGAQGPFALPLWGLIPLTLCLTAPYLACQRSWRSQVSVPSACRIQSPSSDSPCYSKRVMNKGVSTGSPFRPCSSLEGHKRNSPVSFRGCQKCGINEGQSR